MKKKKKTAAAPEPDWGFLERVMQTPSPSGFEFELQRLLADHMRGAVDRLETDVHGNLAGVFNPDGAPRVMLAGHCDEVGLMVKYIDEQGFLYATPIGSPSISALNAQRVRVAGEKGSVAGVIMRKRPEKDEKKELKITDFWIDIGADSRKQAERMTHVGAPIVVDAGFARLGKDRLLARAFDDRLGAFVVAETMRRLPSARPQAAVFGVSTVQEEVGSRGAGPIAFALEPDIGIAVEVNHATDHPEADKKTLGDVALGKGPVLLRGSNINPVVGRLLEQTAADMGMPVQISGFGGPTPTDASVMQVSRSGVATALVKVPVRYMHTPCELVAAKDVTDAIDLLTAFVARLEPGMDLRPGAGI